MTYIVGIILGFYRDYRCIIFLFYPTNHQEVMWLVGLRGTREYIELLSKLCKGSHLGGYVEEYYRNPRGIL